MSIPQQVQYQRNGLNWYSRISDQIEERSVNQASMGIWLDAFDHDWWSKDCLLDLQKSKRLCIVSPELHGRNHKDTWHKMKSITMNSDNMICTDLPIQAKEFLMIKAVVFDMDGVLIDAKDWHYIALNQALDHFGFTISRNEHLTIFDGMPTKRETCAFI